MILTIQTQTNTVRCLSHKETHRMQVSYYVSYRNRHGKIISQSFRHLSGAERFAGMLVGCVRLLQVKIKTENVTQEGTIYVYSKFNYKRVENSDLLAKVLELNRR